MKDKNKILAGLAIFIALISFPFWFNLGKAAPAPELAPECRCDEPEEGGAGDVKGGSQGHPTSRGERVGWPK